MIRRRKRCKKLRTMTIKMLETKDSNKERTLKLMKRRKRIRIKIQETRNRRRILETSRIMPNSKPNKAFQRIL